MEREKSCIFALISFRVFQVLGPRAFLSFDTYSIEKSLEIERRKSDLILLDDQKKTSEYISFIFIFLIYI